ncbi:hypothetical protein EFK50_07835 [Nocardioides marmoriginsengisoli]|uniref:Uncharacterized protein n=1 Tax=Nocardioides marmoriginsengisoli TaxID=661483 RepID=A0A3N0CJM5_9ACTN|nr:Gp19/Gp15/Gp42 family protein [Nocardioides marmoriginsengisoli]RNL63644.1 hypothetical protein EFK50_07835 [Nocardioides marmoriginsengisoli]
MPNPATTADVEARWRPLSAQETINAQTFLDDAWRMLRRHFTQLGINLDELIDTDNELPAEERTLQAEVVRVLVAAVLRTMKNPDGLSQESIDDYTYKRDEAVAAGLLYFTDDELDGLIPGSGEKGRAYMIDPLADYASRFDS